MLRPAAFRLLEHATFSALGLASFFFLATFDSLVAAAPREQRLECRVRQNTQSIDEFWIRGPAKSLATSKNLRRVNPQGINFRYRIPMGEITGAGGWVTVRYQEQSDHWVVGLQKDSLISGQRIQADGSEVGESHSFAPLRRGKSILYVTLTLTDQAATRTPTRIDLDCHLNSGG